MREGIPVGLSSAVALILSGFACIGAPPSQFVQEPNIWKHLEFLMWPSLFAGVGLSGIALFLTALFHFRGAAVVCVAAIIVSMIGVIIAWGIDADATARVLLKSLAILSLPMIGAINAIRRFVKTNGKNICAE
jgi:hypothetical protein